MGEEETTLLKENKVVIGLGSGCEGELVDEFERIKRGL